MKYLIYNISRQKNTHSLLNQALTSAIGFFSFIILTRSLDKHSFGMWVIYITGLSLMEMLRSGLTSVAVVRFLSGADEVERKKILGSNWNIGIITAIPISILIFGIYLLFPSTINNSGYLLFFKYYPLVIFLNLPYINALTALAASQKFGTILLLRLAESGSFFIFLLLNHFVFHFGVEKIIFAQIIILTVVSAISIFNNLDGIKYLFHSDKITKSKLLNFGKFSIGTMIGSNLLKSADTFIIGLSPFLGTHGVALYSIPLKLIEFLEIPLRSFSATVFPRMSKHSNEGKIELLQKDFYIHSGALTILFLPIAAIGFIFAEPIMRFVGGVGYEEAANVFRVFMIYSIFLPIDRFSGVALDSLNKPHKNFYKIIFMAFANVIGDLIAVFVFKSLFFVSLATIAFTVIGVIIGLYYLGKDADIKFKHVLPEGMKFLISSFHKVRHLSGFINKSS